MIEFSACYRCNRILTGYGAGNHVCKKGLSICWDNFEIWIKDMKKGGRYFGS
jgi:hypothetical protein